MDNRVIAWVESFTGLKVCTAPLSLSSCIQYQDVRSATLFAMGEAIKSKSTAMVIIPGEYLASTYTALTEAWFQKANVVVVALFENESGVRTSYLDRCLLANITIGLEEFEKSIEQINAALELKGPALISIVDHEHREKQLVQEIMDMVAAVGKKVLCADEPYKYGTLSKYIGMSSVSDVGILVASADEALVDANIFRTRYANTNMKIILCDNGELSKNHFQQWIESNSWRCLTTSSLRIDDIQNLISQNKQTVLIIE